MDRTRRHASCGLMCRHSAFSPSNEGLCMCVCGFSTCGICLFVLCGMRTSALHKDMRTRHSTNNECILDSLCLHMSVLSPFPSRGSLWPWTRPGAGMAGQGAARAAGCRWSWWGRWRAPEGGAVKAGVSSAWRTGSASELPWNRWKTEGAEVEAKLRKIPTHADVT